MTSRFARAKLATSMCVIPLFWFALNGLGCHQDATHVEGVDPSAYPPEVRDDFVLFTVRCSKCHALSRALQSGITNDDYWADYVERMRRQPGSGIAPDESPRIQRFLHYYSMTVRARNESAARGEGMSVGASPAAVVAIDGGDAW